MQAAGLDALGQDETPTYAAVSALAWRRRDVHVVAINPRHALNLAGSL